MKKDKPIPWSYRKTGSPIHRLPAPLKLGFLMFLSMASFFPNIFVVSAIAVILALLSVAAGIYPWELLRGSGSLFSIIAGVFLLKSLEFPPVKFNLESILEGTVFCVRIGAAFSAASLLFAVTRISEIRKSLSQLEIFFGFEKLNISIGVYFMLAFLPKFFEAWEDLNLAWKNRAGKNSLSKLILLAPALVEKMMSHAADAAVALEARGKKC